MPKSYLVIFSLCLFFQFSFAQPTDSQKALNKILSLQLENENDFTILKDSLDSNKAIFTEQDLSRIYQRVINQSREIKNDSIFFHYIELQSFNHLILAEYEEAIENSNAWITHAEAIKDTNNIILGHVRLGICYSIEGDGIKTYENYSKALHLADAIGNEAYKKKISINLSSCYQLMGRDDDAYLLIKEVIANSQQQEEISVLNELVVCYTILFDLEAIDSLEKITIISDLEKSLAKLENHQEIGQNESAKSSCSQAYFFLHEYFAKISNLTKAEYYFNKVLNSELSHNSSKTLASLRHALLKKDLETAKKYINKENEEKYSNQEYSFLAANYYHLTKNFERELFFTKKNLLKKIDLLYSDKANLNEFINSQLKNAEKAKQISLIEKELENQNFRNKAIGLIAVLLGSLLAFGIFYFLQIRKKAKLLKKQKQIIQKQAEDLQANIDQKSIFFTNIAHEYQVPLSIIKGLTKKINTLDNIQVIKSLLPIILRNGTQLSEYTSQILELTKNDETPTSVNESYFYLDQLIKYQVNEMQVLAMPKNITIHSHDIENNKIVYSDIEKIKTILKNLLSNAIKYSPLNSEISLKQQSIDEQTLQIIIEDQGKGIPPEKLETIFNRFYQTHNQKEMGGFGIGLAIVKEYTHVLNGEIKVNSKENKGSQFILNIPNNVNGETIDRNSIYTFPPEKLYEVEVNPQKVNDQFILIVEDNIDYCKYLSSILEDRYSLIIFHNAQDSLSFLKNNTPDLIITDWMLPEIDGLEFIKKIREGENKVPVLILTARNLLSDKLKALNIGGDDYLVKTVDEEILIQRIEYLLQKNKNVLNAGQINLINSSPIHQIVKDISKYDQEWLLKFEQITLPKIHEFNLNIDELAALMNMSATHLFRKMKTITGLTPKKYIQEIRFWEARRLLELSQVDSVKAASLSVGFKDPKNFSKNFKDRFGDYPSAFLSN